MLGSRVPDVLTLADLSVSEKSLPPFEPPPRFGKTRFEDYRPQHPSQEEACETARAFIRTIETAGKGAKTAASGFRWPWQRSLEGRGLYLDGGFGVGKTHLLASAYHACGLGEEAKAYLSFQELVYVIGQRGMAGARASLEGYRLFCIDEFELDDPGNTLIVKTFLKGVFAGGSAVVTTSNTPPEAQGQGRFNADDFKREIQSIAERFETVSIEGPDFRQRDRLATFLSEDELARLQETEAGGPKGVLSWGELLELLRSHHPIRYYDLLKGVGTLYVSGLSTLPDQNDALRFVHFIDKLYDLNVGFRASSDISLDDLFGPSYRRGAFLKKFERCLSRLSELLEAGRA